ncbi:hypothetical protein ACFLS1_05720 [Verrucomicrobiota bacterium]
MKKTISIIMLVLLTYVCSAAEKKPEHEKVTFNALKISAESYNNKKVVYTSPFINVVTSRQIIMEKVRLSPKKYMWLEIGGSAVPVIVKKSDEMTKFVTNLKKGDVLRVYGKVKKFRGTYMQSLLSHYYIEVENIEETGETVEIKPEAKKRPAIKQKRPVRFRK